MLAIPPVSMSPPPAHELWFARAIEFYVHVSQVTCWEDLRVSQKLPVILSLNSILKSVLL